MKSKTERIIKTLRMLLELDDIEVIKAVLESILEELEEEGKK